MLIKNQTLTSINSKVLCLTYLLPQNNSLLNTNIWPLFLYYGDIEKTFYFQTGSTRIARSQLLDLNSISPCQPIFTCILVGNSVIVSTSPDNRHSLIKDANSFNTWHLFIGTFRGINRQATFLVFTLLCIYLNVHLVAPCSVSVYSLLQHVYVYTLMQPSYQIKRIVISIIVIKPCLILFGGCQTIYTCWIEGCQFLPHWC